jgi:two-component system, cell cycle response regulator DivK
MMPALVLIVDDNDLNRKLARDVLRASGLETIEAANGEDAIAIAGARLPDVILMDLRLPDLDGSGALLRLKANRATAGIPVIAMTALKDASDALLGAGFSGYIEKPIDVVAFPGQVQSFARNGGG